MATFTQKKCPTCGGRLENISGKQYECRCCHNVYEMNEENTSLYDSLQTASTFRESLNFKQAEMLYKNMLKRFADGDLSDVYWNLLLCEQRVMFETDQNGEQFPSFYDIAPTEIDESEYYAKAMEYAQEYDTNKLMSFVDLANKMQEAKNKYRTIKSTTKPYDIFICFKKSSIKDPTKLTMDYQLAMDIYNNLSKDYRVFFSERSLNNIVVREYEPNIYHALYTAKVMLVICSNRAYLDSQWVRNEWSRFKMMTRTSAQAKSIIPILRNNFQPEQLPDELRNCQGIRDDMSLLYNLTQAVKTIINPVDKQAELAAALEAKMKAELEEMRKMFAAQATTQSKPQSATQSKAVISPKLQFKGRKDLTSIVIPNDVTHIDNRAFEDCTGLITVTMHNNVTSIGDYAFSGCSSLEKITLSDNVTSVGKWAFWRCANIKSIIIPNKVTEIGSYAFAMCEKLSSINIPTSVKIIGNEIFNWCKQVKDIYYGGTSKQWANIKTGEMWNYKTKHIVVHCTDKDIKI